MPPPTLQDYPSPTPVSLLVRLQQPGDDAAWGQFVRLYTPLLYSWARRAGLQESDAADLVQDIFVHLLRKLPAFRYNPALSFRGWLRTVAANLWRERRQRPAHAPAGSLLGVVAADTLEALIDREYRDRLVQRALQLMRADFQQATWQACWQVVVEGRPAEEVAHDLGLSVGAVYAAKFRVLNRLRQELDGVLE